MPEKYLIVNADDYNTDRERNRGILQAARDGIVTSATVIANLPWEDNAIPDLQEVLGNRIGIHLNLTKGSPLASCTDSLVNENGQFFEKKKAWRRAMLKGYNLKEIESEFAAQITRLKDAGIMPGHIDGNNHIHVFPGIADVVARLANDFGIDKVRLPLELFNTGDYFKAGTLKKCFIGTLSKGAKPIFKRFNLRFPDYFAGLQFPNVTDVESLGSFIKTLPHGITELMCHPGFRNESNNFSTIQREKELLSLTNFSILEKVRYSDIKLISYNDI